MRNSNESLVHAWIDAANRRDNFDIYLPLWLARYYKHIFGTLYVGGVVTTFVLWLGQ